MMAQGTEFGDISSPSFVTVSVDLLPFFFFISPPLSLCLSPIRHASPPGLPSTTRALYAGRTPPLPQPSPPLPVCIALIPPPPTTAPLALCTCTTMTTLLNSHSVSPCFSDSTLHTSRYALETMFVCCGLFVVACTLFLVHSWQVWLFSVSLVVPSSLLHFSFDTCLLFSPHSSAHLVSLTVMLLLFRMPVYYLPHPQPSVLSHSCSLLSCSPLSAHHAFSGIYDHPMDGPDIHRIFFCRRHVPRRASSESAVVIGRRRGLRIRRGQFWWRRRQGRRLVDRESRCRHAGGLCTER